MGGNPEAVLADLVAIVRGMTDWEYPAEITRETRFFADLGFESIDAVVFGEAIEAHYGRRLPYADFLRGLADRDQRDLTVGELVDFLRLHLEERTEDPRTEPVGGAGGLE